MRQLRRSWAAGFPPPPGSAAPGQSRAIGVSTGRHVFRSAARSPAAAAPRRARAGWLLERVEVALVRGRVEILREAFEQFAWERAVRDDARDSDRRVMTAARSLTPPRAAISARESAFRRPRAARPSSRSPAAAGFRPDRLGRLRHNQCRLSRRRVGRSEHGRGRKGQRNSRGERGVETEPGNAVACVVEPLITQSSEAAET